MHKELLLGNLNFTIIMQCLHQPYILLSLIMAETKKEEKELAEDQNQASRIWHTRRIKTKQNQT